MFIILPERDKKMTRKIDRQRCFTTFSHIFPFKTVPTRMKSHEKGSLDQLFFSCEKKFPTRILTHTHKSEKNPIVITFFLPF